MKNLSDLGEKDIVNVSNYDRDIEFRNLLEEKGYKTFNGDSYLDKDNFFDKYGKKLCYAPNQKMYTSIKFALKNGYTIHPSTDFVNDPESIKLRNTIMFLNDVAKESLKSI